MTLMSPMELELKCCTKREINCTVCFYPRPRSCVTPHENFYKDVILLQNPEEKNVVKQNSKQKLYEMGHILNAFEFSKNWDSMTVMFKLRDAFHAKIPDDVR